MMNKSEAFVWGMAIAAAASVVVVLGSCGREQVQHQAKFEDVCAVSGGTTVKLNGYLSCAHSAAGK